MRSGLSTCFNVHESDTGFCRGRRRSVPSKECTKSILAFATQETECTRSPPMSESQLDTQEFAELAAPSERPTHSRAPSVIAGGVIGVLAPCLLAFIFNERTWDEYAEYYGTGFELIFGLLMDVLVPVLISGVTGAAAGYGVWCAVSSQIAVRLRALAGGAVAGSVIANLIAVASYSSKLFTYQSLGGVVTYQVLPDVIWLITCPTLHGAWMGAILALGIACAFEGQSVSPKTVAFGWAIVAAVLSTIAMFVIGALSAPPSNYHGGTGMGPAEVHGIIFMLIHLAIVLPISSVVGAVFGWRRHKGQCSHAADRRIDAETD